MKVSIVIPLFNRASLILDTLRSVQQQTHRDIECIIVDDHSDDDSFQIVSEFSKEDGRFVIQRRTSDKKGAPVCRNQGMKYATGSYLMFLDSDDLLSKSCISERLKCIQQNEGCDFLVHHVAIFDDMRGDLNRLWCDLDQKDDLESFLKGTGWQTSSTFFNSLFVKKFTWNEAACSWQDWEFHISILLSNPTYKKIANSSPDVFIRRGNSSRISSGNRSFARIDCLFKLFRVIQNDLIRHGKHQYVAYMTGNWFVFMEIASIQLTPTEYAALRNIWISSLIETVQWQGLMRWYFQLQNFFSKKKIKFGNSIAYRLVRFILPANISKSTIKSQ